MRRLVGWLRDSLPAALAGAFLLAGASLLFADRARPGQTLVLLLVGALYALPVRALLGLFPFRGAGLVLAGILSGPLPAVVLLSLRRESMGEEDRGGLWLLLLVFGLVIGWAEAAGRGGSEDEPLP